MKLCILLIKSTNLFMFFVIASVLLLGTISSENAFADEITITEDTFGTIVVEEGTKLVLDGTTHTGKIIVKGGELLLIGGCTIDGKITSTSGSIHASQCVLQIILI